MLGQTELSLREVVSMQPGSVFELDKLATEPIDLYVNNILIARGEVVVVDDKFAVKISELNPSSTRSARRRALNVRRLLAPFHGHLGARGRRALAARDDVRGARAHARPHRRHDRQAPGQRGRIDDRSRRTSTVHVVKVGDRYFWSAAAPAALALLAESPPEEVEPYIETQRKTLGEQRDALLRLLARFRKTIVNRRC